jgi:hypothetical protein
MSFPNPLVLNEIYGIAIQAVVSTLAANGPAV